MDYLRQGGNAAHWEKMRCAYKNLMARCLLVMSLGTILRPHREVPLMIRLPPLCLL
jgi:hypothetical protein